MIAFNFEAFFISFGLIFLAELGDKTQLMVITLSAKEKSPLRIGISTSIGISLVAVIGILLGFSASIFIPLFWIKVVGVIIFLTFGIYTLIKLKRHKNHLEQEAEDIIQESKNSRIKINNKFIFPMVSVFLMEFGDKTQIMTISLAANYLSPVEVGLGVILSLTLLCFIGAYLGDFISRKLSKKWIDLGAGIFFIVMGALLLIEAVLSL
ncbi:MAG TPA: TMEM165/GDT1 family protein [Candidatus Deferrimicrobium sp.]|nr:TMEM165/GDT1 family protein [Candidatus Deferrimicrobium sp.]